MNTYQLKVPQDVPFEVIKAALAALGEVTIRAVIPKPPKAERVYQEPVTVYKNGIAVDEIDSITVEKRIAKIMAEVNRGHQNDGRIKGHFDRASRDFAHRQDTASYIQTFCNALNHKPTQYELHGETVTA